MTKRYLTLEQASEICHMSVKTLQAKIRLGLLAAYKPGRSLLVDSGELDLFIKRARKRTAS